jgi:glucose-6-phosphate dehydrogenase assembly protein OpcA
MAQSLTARRSATVTVLVLADSAADAVSARETFGALSVGYPIHGIVLEADQGHPTARRRALINGLARGDLPLVLWRPAGLPSRDDPSLGWVDHLVVDSRSISGLPALVEITGRLPVTDLAWVDLAPWRELIAGLFDGPDFGPFLGHVRHVRVQGDEPLRRLLAGWLLGRLRLAPTTVEVLASEQASVEVTAEHDGRRAQFSVAWSAQSALIDARAVVQGGPSHVRRWRPAESSPARLLDQVLTRLHRDPLYKEALTAALTLARRRGLRERGM